MAVVIEPPPAADSMPVQLARMEGTLNLVADRVSGLMTRVDRHEVDLGELKSATQTLSERMAAEATKAIALASALKEADEARRTKSETTWSPFAKTITAMAGLVGIASLYIQTRGG
jgi:hypothetical protein